MPSELTKYFEPAGRFMEILVGVLILSASGLLGYFGARGAWMYLHGSRAATADPFACAIGLGAGMWGAYSGVRMLCGWRKDRALVPAALLLVAGMFALLGGALLVILDLSLHLSLPRALGVGITLAMVGIAAIKFWWRRRHTAAPE
jgi:hypothetical protein